MTTLLGQRGGCEKLYPGQVCFASLFSWIEGGGLVHWLDGLQIVLKDDNQAVA